MSTDYKFKKLLTRRYQLLASVLILLALGLLLLPKHIKNDGISPELFVKNVLSDERFISSDHLVDRMINKDPSMILVDVRPKTEFEKFTLPGAMSVPLENLREPLPCRPVWIRIKSKRITKMGFSRLKFQNLRKKNPNR